MSLPFNFNPVDGSLLPFDAGQIDAMQIGSFNVRDGSHPTHRREFNSSTIRASYLVAADQFEAFVGFMLGGCVTFVGLDGVTRLSRLMPQVWPTQTEFAAVAIESAQGQRILGDDPTVLVSYPVPEYDTMRVDVTFQHVPFQLAPDATPNTSTNELSRYVQELPSEQTADYLTLPGGIMKLVTTTGGAPPGSPAPPQLNHNVGIPLPAEVIRRKWLRLPYNAWNRGSTLYSRVYGNPATNPPTQAFIGTVNTDSSLFGYQAGQLLFLGVEAELQLDPIGVRVWNLTYKWLVKPMGHNFFYWYPAAGGGGVVGTWCFATADGNYYAPSTLGANDGKTIFNGRQHQLLFAVGTSL